MIMPKAITVSWRKIRQQLEEKGFWSLHLALGIGALSEHGICMFWSQGQEKVHKLIRELLKAREGSLRRSMGGSRK